jgi:hypothetical protein
MCSYGQKNATVAASDFTAADPEWDHRDSASGESSSVSLVGEQAVDFEFS